MIMAIIVFAVIEFQVCVLIWRVSILEAAGEGTE
jgi:hypothetical protein